MLLKYTGVNCMEDIKARTKVVTEALKELKELAKKVEGWHTIQAWGLCQTCGGMVPVTVKVLIEDGKVVKVEV